MHSHKEVTGLVTVFQLPLHFLSPQAFGHLLSACICTNMEPTSTHSMSSAREGRIMEKVNSAAARTFASNFRSLRTEAASLVDLPCGGG